MTPEELQGWKGSNMILGKSRGQLLIAQKERICWAKTETTLIVDVSGDESKIRYCKE